MSNSALYGNDTKLVSDDWEPGACHWSDSASKLSTISINLNISALNMGEFYSLDCLRQTNSFNCQSRAS
jgi:hypothetical protein